MRKKHTNSLLDHPVFTTPKLAGSLGGATRHVGPRPTLRMVIIKLPRSGLFFPIVAVSIRDKLPGEMGEGFVGIGHSMYIIACRHGGAFLMESGG